MDPHRVETVEGRPTPSISEHVTTKRKWRGKRRGIKASLSLILSSSFKAIGDAVTARNLGESHPAATQRHAGAGRTDGRE